MFENDAFQQLLRDYPDAIFDYTKFKGLLNDVLPEDRSLRRLLLHLHELGIQDELYSTGVITNILAHRFTRLLVEDYGISEENARLGVYTWCICYGKSILGKPCELYESHTEFVSDTTQSKGVSKKNLPFNPLRKITSALKEVSKKNKVLEDADVLPCEPIVEVPTVNEEKVAKPPTEAEAVGKHEVGIDETEAKIEDTQIAVNVESEENEAKVLKTESDKPVEEPVKKEKVDKLPAVPSAVRTINRPFKDSRVWQPPPPVVPPIEEVNSQTSNLPLEMEEMPLDIPFMDGRIKRPPPPPSVIPTIEEVTSPTINFPPDVMSQVIKARNHKMPVVPEPESSEAVEEPKYVFPPLDLLSRGAPQSRAGDSEVNLNSERLETAFQSLGINVNIKNATRGPSVTRYEVELEAGVRLSRLTNMANDIALSLGVESVNIAAVPGKIATVGIDVPKKSIDKVHLRDIIESDEFVRSQSRLTFVIGKDSISGDTIIGNFKELSHLLITGTTGSGKSTLLNSIIMSALYKATPKEVRLILISPNTSEFDVYVGLPHLLAPVITDVKRVTGVLQVITQDIMRRYNLFAETGTKEVESYNIIATSLSYKEPLPYVLIVIDELADIMLKVKKEVEELICDIAQKGHLAGIHLVLATQTPRTNVVPELMKSKLNSRISFRVSSAYESRFTLGINGAEKLNGNGDMLYTPIGAVKPTRVQGAWVSDKEREKVVAFIENSMSTRYADDALCWIEKATYGTNSDGVSSYDTNTDSKHDELMTAAVDVVLETGQVSVSMIQRRLSLGYARAARIVDQMEEMGIIGPYEGSKPRALLIDRNQWRQMQYGTGSASYKNSTTLFDTLRKIAKDD